MNNNQNARPITETAANLGLSFDDINPHGKYIAKIPLQVYEDRRTNPDGNLILVTAVTPTKEGEGKTTVTIGLADALRRIGKKAALCVREPSLGPYFGVKGGATGGGLAQIIPAEDINLHFTGDMYAVTKANNLLSAMVDNHIHHGNPLGIDSRRVTWRRVIDLNDRALRDIIVGLGGIMNGFPRRDGFDITPASEVMAILSLSTGLPDLRERLRRIVVGYTYDQEPVTAAQLKADGAMMVLLRDAVEPNLVQTIEGTPAFVHGGAFANVAHGCNTIFATRTALKLADYVVTEAGFATDLGAEKFFDIKCRVGGLHPKAAVVVATIRALKYHGGLTPDTGFANLAKHVENVRAFGVPAIVALNRFADDSNEDIAAVEAECHRLNVPFAVSDGFNTGGGGAVDLANTVLNVIQTTPSNYAPLYPLDMPIVQKAETVARTIYGANGARFDAKARASIKVIEKIGCANLPICVAKTPASLSDRAELRGRPTDFNIIVNEARLSAGAGLIVMLAGSIVTMPGLPKVPAAEHMLPYEEPQATPAAR